MTRFALYVPLEAKPGKEKEVADFLRAAVPLVNAEPGTISWYAIQEGPSSFAIFDTFDDEAGRDAHLNGKVAAALMEKITAGDMFAKTPEIHKLNIIADKSAKYSAVAAWPPWFFHEVCPPLGYGYSASHTGEKTVRAIPAMDAVEHVAPQLLSTGRTLRLA